MSSTEVFPTFRVRAENDAADSRNAIHDDATAKRLGYSGALVPGVTVFAFALQPVAERFGERFLANGRFSLRLRRPVYEGQHVSASASPLEGDRFEVSVANEEGDVCATGEGQHPLPRRDAVELPEEAPLPDVRRPATPEELAARPLLGTLHGEATTERLAALNRQLGDALPLFRKFVHPAWLLRQANIVIDRNLDVGPWIHTASDLDLLEPLPLGAPYSVRAQAGKLYERKGNDYADFDIAILTGDRPVMRVLHRAIYRMGANA